MKPIGVIFTSIAAFLFTLPAFADNSCSSIVKDFPGTYTLVKRTLADGTVLKGPQVHGTVVFTPKGRSSVTISVHNLHDNTYDMVALQTQYAITDTKFSNRILAMALQFGKPSSPVKYVFNQSELSSPIICKDGVLDIQHPADYPLSDLTLSKDGKLVAIHSDPELKGAIDEWVKLK